MCFDIENFKSECTIDTRNFFEGLNEQTNGDILWNFTFIYANSRKTLQVILILQPQLRPVVK